MNNIISSKNTSFSHLIATFPIKREVLVLLKQNTKSYYIYYMRHRRHFGLVCLVTGNYIFRGFVFPFKC